MASADVTVRFAPSPTGRLHVGNGRVALLNWLYARKFGGRFILRHDDTDTERSTEEFVQAIELDLTWLGLSCDARYRQSERRDRYAAGLDRLVAAGRAYPCFESAEELGLKRKTQLAAGRAPIYDRAALKLTARECDQFEAAGHKPHWRFLVDAKPVQWDDVIHGPMRFSGSDLSDPVLVREDGTPLYTFTSVVDDGEMGITHVIRGDDHLANTAVQIQLFQALGAAVPVFSHLALFTGAGGEGLSKRLGSLSLSGLREQGIEAMAINCLLARLGSSDPVEPVEHLADLVAGVDLSHFGRAPAKFDPEELTALNHKVLQKLPYATVRDRLAALGVPGDAGAFWDAVRPNLTTLNEAADWVRIAQGPIAPVVEDPAFAAAAAQLLPAAPWGEHTWSDWTHAVGSATGAKGKKLFRPLRLALTGREHGPEMMKFLPFIGRERAAARLAGETA